MYGIVKSMKILLTLCTGTGILKRKISENITMNENEKEKEIVAVPVQIESIFRFNCRRIWMRRMTGRRRRMNRVGKRRRGWPCVALFAGKTTL
jgi:hypothetical protein